MGGAGAALDAALTYSNIVFAGVILIWLFNSLANVIRGTGNMAVPAIVTLCGAAMLVPLSPALIFGWGPFPRSASRAARSRLFTFYALGSTRARAAICGPAAASCGLRCTASDFAGRCFATSCGSARSRRCVTVATNVTIAISTGLVGASAPAAIAGYGVGSRLEYLLIPLAFGFGGPLVALVGTNIGAGQRQRALRAAWIGGGIARPGGGDRGRRGAFPAPWLTLFDSDPAMIEAGSPICGSSDRSTGSSVSAWRFTSPRKGPVRWAGRCWPGSLGWSSPLAAVMCCCNGPEISFGFMRRWVRA